MLAAAAILVVLSAAEPALVVTEERTPYDVDWISDGALTLAGFTAVGIVEAFVVPNLEGGLACIPPPGKTRCPSTSLGALDRTAVGLESTEWRRASDATMGLGIAGALAGLTAEAYFGGGDSNVSDMLTDALVIAEATALSMVVTYGLKISLRRPRPTHYTEGAPVDGFEMRMSFPSGHTSTAAAVSTAYAMTFALRHPDSPWRVAVFGGAALVTGLTGYSRVAGGRHFWTDVFGGALVGGLSGVLVPLLHLRAADEEPRPVQVGAVPVEGGALIQIAGSL